MKNNTILRQEIPGWYTAHKTHKFIRHETNHSIYQICESCGAIRLIDILCNKCTSLANKYCSVKISS